MTFDTVVRDCRMVVPFVGVVEGNIGITNGTIAAITQPSESITGHRVIDAGGRHVLPGVIDPHVHLGYLDPDGVGTEFRSESGHGALGGVTSFIKMERTFEPYGGLLDQTIDLGERNSVLDFGFHVTLMTEQHLDEFDKIAQTYGVTSYKFFMGIRDPEPGSISKQGVDDGFLWTGLNKIATLKGGVALVHAENQQIIWRLRKEWQAANRGNDRLSSWTRTSPPVAEAENILRAGFLGHHAGCPVYVVHLSSHMGLEVVRSLREQGYRIDAETCPQYLTHHEDSPEGFLVKVNPPVRSPEDNEALWAGLESGSLRHMGSDHGAKTLPNKHLDGTVWEAAAGFPGMMHILPVLLSEGVNRGRLGLQRVAELTAGQPARTFGLHQKGTIRVGGDADLVLVDLDEERTVSHTWHHSGAPYSIYEGHRLKGWPVLTMVRGTVVAEGDTMVGEPGHGRYIRRDVG